MLITILAVLLILWLIGSFPRADGYNAGWGYGPVGIGTVLIVILIVLLLDGRI